MANSRRGLPRLVRRQTADLDQLQAESAAAHFGMPLAVFARLDVPASSKRTREQFGWEPAEPGLIADIDARHYANAASTHQSA